MERENGGFHVPTTSPASLEGIGVWEPFRLHASWIWERKGWRIGKKVKEVGEAAKRSFYSDLLLQTCLSIESCHRS